MYIFEITVYTSSGVIVREDNLGMVVIEQAFCHNYSHGVVVALALCNVPLRLSSKKNFDDDSMMFATDS